MGPDNASRTEVLFPEIDPYAVGRLAVDARHTLYWETCGKPDGVPLVFLHGGPGGASLPHHRRYYDPLFWRIVLFDQRGAGRSTPAADLTDNTTRHLVADIERLREHLRIDKWLLFGGSWGSTLALAYAQAHPERCLGLVLRGSSSRARWSSTGSCTGCASCSPKHGGRSSNSSRRRSAPTSWRAITAD
jgi:proline iminopeptidase